MVQGELPVNQESRVKKTLKNARVNLIFYFLTLALSFFSRKIFLDTLGADFVGLTSTLQNLLGFLNLAELGVGTAIGYVLYKPLFEHNQDKINEIISVMGYLYRNIGLIILGAGFVLACFLPLIFPSTGFDLLLIYFAYFAFLTSSLIGYFVNYRQNLLGADQKNYVVTACYQTISILKILIQMASAYYTGSYILWVVIELTFGILYSIVLNIQINKVYPWLKSEIRLGKKLFKKYPEVWKYTKQLFVHKITGFVQNQTTPFFVYAFVSLKTVAYYGNYTIITDKLSILISNFLDSTSSGVGNLVAENNVAKEKGVFEELLSLRFLIAGILIFAVYHLLPPFISLWLGPEYVMSNTVLILLLTSFFISITRGVVDQFLFAHGLFYDVWAPAVEAAIYIITALFGGHFWGLEGILLGGILSKIVIVCIWKPYFLFNKGFKRSVWRYWLEYLKNIALLAIPAIVLHKFFLLESVDTWLQWLVYALKISMSYTVVAFILMLCFTDGIKKLLKRFLKRT